MKKICDFLIRNKYIDIIIILLFLLTLVLLCDHNFVFIFADRGREFFLPQEILNGAVPYKDINLIYFPTAYYINALVYKLLGVSVNSLIISQTAICFIFLIGYYGLAKEFLSRKLSLLLTLMIIPAVIVTKNDLFSWLLPYSYARVYGCVSSLFCIYALVKLLKSGQSKFAYIAAVLAGFSCCCKMEFLPVIFIMFGALYLNKCLNTNFNFVQYLKMLLCFLIFPVTVVGVLIIQGVTFNHIYDALIFGYKFATTDVMREFLSNMGINPTRLHMRMNDIMARIPELLAIILLCFLGLKLKIKYLKPVIMLFVVIVVFKYYSLPFNILRYWLWLPFFVFFTMVLKIKELIKSDKILLFLLISSCIMACREFYNLDLMIYGTFPFPLMILSFLVIIDKFLPKDFAGVKIENLVCCVIIALIPMYVNSTYTSRLDLEYSNPIKTAKGTFYVGSISKEILDKAISYVNSNIDKDKTVLVLPEGNIINFVTDRKVDLQCFMMDRLYHDAYGEEEAKNRIAKSKPDYILIVSFYDNNFDRPSLYKESSSSSAAKYIYENYNIIELYEFDNYTDLKILKRIEE